MKFSVITKIAGLAFAVVGIAHPGEEHEEHNEAARLAKREFYANAKRRVGNCAEHLERRGIYARAEARRRATVEKHRNQPPPSHAKDAQLCQQGHLVLRDTDTVLNTTHHSNKTGITMNSPDCAIFTTTETCVLNPEGETGPYWVKGEHIRSDLRESQPGVPIIIDGQFLDMETCEPIQDLYWDIWNCNSTGVYSGLVANGNGNTNDLSNYNATFLRGVQKTDEDGVVQFKTVFPGHYSGRTTHHHIVAHLNATVLPNNTLTGGTVAHVGQLFWDQDLIYAVEATYPYNTNNITITTNAADRVFTTETEDTTSDPVLNYVYLGDGLADGLFAWVTMVVNVSATYDPNYSFVYTAAGGVAESGGSNEVPDGTGNGTAPSGSGMPSGAVPSGTAVPSA